MLQNLARFLKNVGPFYNMHERVNDAESLDFVISGTINKKMQVHQFQVEIVPPACNFVKNKTPTQVFSC